MLVWDIYYASIVAMTIHPGYTKENANPMNLKDAALFADLMLKEREKRYDADNYRSDNRGSEPNRRVSG